MEDSELLTKIHEIAVRVDDRTKRHTREIDHLRTKQNEACERLARLEEQNKGQDVRLRGQDLQLQDLRKPALKAGGGAGAGAGAAVAGAMLVIWEYVKHRLLGN